jgi:opacity protein-like surface antigen
MKAAWCVAALLAGFIAVPASARAELPLDKDASLDRPRFYLGFGPLIGVENFHVGTQSASFGGPTVSGMNADIDDASYGGEMRVGYRFHPYLAAELQGQYNGQFDVKGDTHGPLGRPLLGTVRAVTSTANLKLYALTGPVQPYALGGVGMLWADTENKASGADLPVGDVEFAGRGGLGVDTYISPMLAITAEGSYVAPVGSLARYGLAAITVGMQWHF